MIRRSVKVKRHDYFLREYFRRKQVMENRDLIVFGLLLLQPCFIKTLSGAFICNSLSDSMINIVSQEHDSKRLKAMEEKITQLQKLVTAELQNATSLKDSIPAGKYFLLQCMLNTFMGLRHDENTIRPTA